MQFQLNVTKTTLMSNTIWIKLQTSVDSRDENSIMACKLQQASKELSIASITKQLIIQSRNEYLISPNGSKLNN